MKAFLFHLLLLLRLPQEVERQEPTPPDDPGECSFCGKPTLSPEMFFDRDECQRSWYAKRYAV